MHLANSAVYQSITGCRPLQPPPTAKDYSRGGLPWFDYYSEGKTLPGSGVLSKLTSLATKVIEKGQPPLTGNEPVQLKIIKPLGKTGTVREGEF